MKDDGYDIADYRNVHPDYGALRDFKEFLKGAHRRGIRVITELVMNHTSSRHEWFQRSRRSGPNTAWRNYYVWSDTPTRYADTRIIFQDFEHSNWAWDPVAQAYYWHRFYSHQPDLNFESPQVKRAMFKALDFWLRMGVDGLRLDAVPYLFEREGTNCENLPETYEFIRELRRHIDENHRDKMVLAEANQWPEDAVAYFGSGDSCNMAFHFPLMPRMFMALEMENKYPIINILEQTPSVPESCQWAIFLRNHDELTLEMVTDEERDYMYRVYAMDQRARINLGIRRRLAPLLDNDRRKIELMNVLLLTLPGSPVIYYGDEIGMGDNYYLGDRDGVRTPMQWNANKNAGFSDANPQKLYLPVIIDPQYHYETINVETQSRSQYSLLWWMRRIIARRKRYRAFGRGKMEFVHLDNVKVLAYIRSHEDESILVVANLSRNAQMVEIDLSKYQGRVPEDMFGQTRFLPVTESPYVLSLGPYAYFVLVLKPPQETIVYQAESRAPQIRAKSWATLFDEVEPRGRLEKHVLPGYIYGRRWFGGKARRLKGTKILESLRLGKTRNSPAVLLVEVSYTEGEPEIYVLPLTCRPIEDSDSELPPGTVALLDLPNWKGVLQEAVYDEEYCRTLLAVTAGRKRIAGPTGRLIAGSTRDLREIFTKNQVDLTPNLLGVEQSNTSIVYGKSLFLKLYRKTDRGMHPDLEMVRYLSGVSGFEHIPNYLGELQYRFENGDNVVIGMMQGFVPNQGDAWTHNLDLVRRFFERALLLRNSGTEAPECPATPLQADMDTAPQPLDELFAGITQEMAELLGLRTAEMHQALARADKDDSFRPEAFSWLRQRALFQSMQNLAGEQLRLLRNNLSRFSAPIQEEARDVLALESEIFSRMRRMLKRKLEGLALRTHGDYHLGQVLYTGKDFVIFDFEGEPARSLSERRLKRSPVRDIAGMLRSYQYAAYTVLHREMALSSDEKEFLSPWAELWATYMGGSFLKGYLEKMKGSPVLPSSMEDFENMLVPFLLEKALYEVGYELNNRPEWLLIPLRGVKQLCGA